MLTGYEDDLQQSIWGVHVLIHCKLELERLSCHPARSGGTPGQTSGSVCAQLPTDWSSLVELDMKGFELAMPHLQQASLGYQS